MPQLNDAWFDFLRGQGFTGAYNDMLLAYLKSLGATANTIPDAYYQLFQGQWNDKFFDFLTNNGAVGGQLNDLLLAYLGGNPVPPPIDDIYWSYPLTSDGIDTVSGDLMINVNPDSREIPVTGGVYVNPANTLAIRADHDYFGKAFEGLLASPVNGAIPTDKISFPTAGKPTVNITFEFEFVMLTDDTNEIFHIEWDNGPYDTYVTRSFNNLEFTHGPDTIAIPYANLISLGQLYKGHVSVTEDFLIGGLNGFEVIRESRTGGQEAVWADKGFIGGFNEVLSNIIVKQFSMKKYEALPPPLGARALSWDFTKSDVIAAATDSINGVVIQESDSEAPIFIAQTNSNEVKAFGEGLPPFDVGEGMLVYSRSQNLFNNSEMIVCPDQAVFPGNAVTDWRGRQVTGIDTGWGLDTRPFSPEEQDLKILRRGVNFVGPAILPQGLEYLPQLIVGHTYVISLFMRMADGSRPVGQVVSESDVSNDFRWVTPPLDLSHQLIEQVGNSGVYRVQCPFVAVDGQESGITQQVTQFAGPNKVGFVVTGLQLENRGINPTGIQRASRYMPTAQEPPTNFEEYSLQAVVSNPTIIPDGNFTAVTEFTILNPSQTNGNPVDAAPETGAFSSLGLLGFDQSQFAVLGYTTKFGPNTDGIRDYRFYFGMLGSESQEFTAQVEFDAPLKAGDRLKALLYSKNGIFTLILENMTTGEIRSGSSVSAEGGIASYLTDVVFGDMFFFRTSPHKLHTFDVRQYTVPPVPQRIPLNALLDDDGNYIMVDGDYLTTG